MKIKAGGWIFLFFSLLSIILIQTIDNPAFAARGDVFSVGEKVMAKEGESWKKATVIEEQSGQYKVHFDGTTDDDDIWVSVYQLTKMSDYGNTYATSKENTFEYKLKAEVEYFCKKDAQRNKLSGPKANGFIENCRAQRFQRLSARPKAAIEPWTPQNAEKWDIHQACIGDTTTNCAQKCGEHSQVFCLPQCLEKVEKCKSSYLFDVQGVKHCSKAAYWQVHEKKQWLWSLPKMVVDDRIHPPANVHSCLAPFARQMSARDDCLQLERCLAVCRPDPSSQNASSVTECENKCTGFFPSFKNPVRYTF